jgi:hypothetical protein
LAAAALFATSAWGQANQRTPRIGYVYPAGGERGSTVEVIVGGQFLRGVTDVYVSGEGTHASVIKDYQPLRNLTPEQRQELRRRLEELRDKRLAELGLQARGPLFPGIGPPVPPAGRANVAAGQPPPARQPAAGTIPAAGQPAAPTQPAGGGNTAQRVVGGNVAPGQPAAEAKPVELPEHPLLRDLDSKNLRQLAQVAEEFLDPQTIRKRQPNPQLAALVLLEVTIDANAAPGDRELRLGTPLGLTNPLCFQVGTLPEVREQEPDDPVRFPNLPKPPPVELPVVLNGQIMPGDIDRFRFHAARGEQLVVETYARHLIPFLADAVPGWFQATVSLYDGARHEVAFDDDYRFDPDPVLFYRVPKDGDYELEIHDALYRGRQDFVYRIAVGELPFITQAFPLGGRTGVHTVAQIDGWNLPGKQVELDTRPGEEGVRQTTLTENGRLSNEVTYAVDSLPECTEAEPNDDVRRAQRIDLPRTVNGRIGRPGDVDVFQFVGHGGDEVVAEVLARRLGSPLDSLLRVTDASGHVLGWNDDFMLKEGQLRPDTGLLTHNADSYLIVELPEDGTYYVHVADAEGHGGDAYAYRLRLAPPRPDFALLMTPSSLSIPAGGAVPLTVHALRKDGFTGDIDVVLKDAPAGFTLSGGRVPSGREHVSMTVAAPPEAPGRPVALQLAGRAQIGEETVSRPIVPAEDETQAFSYRHLVASRELMVVVRPTRWRPLPPQLPGLGPVQVPLGGAALVQVAAPGLARLGDVHLEPWKPTDGVTLADVRVVPRGLSFQLKVGGDAGKAGFADNLIVEVFRDVPVVPQRGNAAPPGAPSATPPASGQGANTAPPATQTQRVSLGVLPAIPFVVVQP